MLTISSKKKINKYAFSGGQTTSEEQRLLGGNPDVDVSFQYLSFFLESDEELEEIRHSYRSGGLLTGELKARCIKELQEFVSSFQARRKAVTPEIVNKYMEVRPLEWGKSRAAVHQEAEVNEAELKKSAPKEKKTKEKKPKEKKT